jgi:hypothetical protein
LLKVFANGSAIDVATSSQGSCGTQTYTPTANQIRKLKVTMLDGATTIVLSPMQEIVSTPYAMVAETLQGKSASSFVQLTGSFTQSDFDAVIAKKAELLGLAAKQVELLDLASGVSSLYLKSGTALASSLNLGSQRITNLASPSAGNDAVNKSYADSRVGGMSVDATVAALGSGAGDNGKVLTWDSTNQKWVALPPGASTAITAITGDVTASGTGSVTATIANGAVTTAKLGDTSVTDAKVSDVGVDKISSGAAKYFGYKPNNSACGNNEFLKWDAANSRWVCGTAGAGSVSSVAFSVPSYMNVSGSPLTSSGTITLGLNSQTAGTVFAAPNGASGTPSFRMLNITDIKSSAGSGTGAFLTGPSCDAGEAVIYSSVSDTLSCASLTLTSAQVLAALPSQTSNAGKVLQTDGTNVSWVTPNAGTVTTVSGSGAISVTNGSLAPSIAIADATTSSKGAMQVGTGLGVSSGTVSVTYGTAAGTAAQGNDARITGALQSSGGTMSGDLNMGLNNITSVGNMPFAAAAPTASENGKTLVFTWGGSLATSSWSWVTPGIAGSGLTNFNGATGTSQSLANGTSGTAPNWSTASNAHTLNIPMASTASVTAGLVSNTDYAAFNAKLGTSTVHAGDVSGAYNNLSVDKIKGKAVTPTTYASGQTLRYDGGQWVNAQLNYSDLSGSVPTASLPALTGDVTSTAGSNSVTLSTVTIAKGGTGATSAAGALTNLLPTQTSNTGKFLQTDGANVSWSTALTSFNGATGATQTLAAPGASGTAPNWSTASNAHTLNIPMASTASVTAGLISNTQYSSFNNKFDPSSGGTISGNVTFSGTVALPAHTVGGALNMSSHQINGVTDPSLAQDAATKNYADTHIGGGTFSTALIGNAGKVLTVNGTADGFILSTPAVGTITGVSTGTVATTGLSGGGTSGTLSLSVNLGTGANQIPQLDASGKLATGVLPSHSASLITSGTLAVAQGGTGAATTSAAAQFFAGPTGAGGTPSFRTIASTDLPSGTLSGSGTAGYLPYYSAGSTLANSAIYTTGGNVGIGTTNPSLAKLVISNSTPASMDLNDTTANTHFRVANNNDSFTIDRYNGTSWPNFVTINNAGNVGIGTTSPEAKLDIVGSSGLPTDGYSGPRVARFKGSNNSVLDIGHDSNNLFANWLQSYDNRNGNSTTYPLLLNPLGGNVGIGTTSPTYALDVVKNATGNVGLRIENQNSGSSSYTAISLVNDGGSIGGIWKNSTTTTGYGGANSFNIGGSAAAPISFVTSNSTRVLIDASGNVGIGTTSPGAKLDVNGGIHPGSATTGASCSGNSEGTFAYDTAAHSPIYCNSSGVWAAIGGSSSGASGPTAQVFSTAGSGTYTTPANVKKLWVRMSGAGQGTPTDGSSGSAEVGEYVELLISSPAASYSYTVGAGGAGGSWTTAGVAANGGSTSFNAVSAGGGHASVGTGTALVRVSGSGSHSNSILTNPSSASGWGNGYAYGAAGVSGLIIVFEYY